MAGDISPSNDWRDCSSFLAISITCFLGFDKMGINTQKSALMIIW
jgi:hypothetical protein